MVIDTGGRDICVTEPLLYFGDVGLIVERIGRPYAELKDLVTGNLVIEVASIEVAAELALGCPIFAFDGSVEVRPVAEM